MSKHFECTRFTLNLLIFMLQLPVLLLAQGIMVISGFFIVPFMLLTGKQTGECQYFTKYQTDKKWCRESFHNWFWLWDNQEDSSIGDKRGWWYENSFFGNSYLWLNRYWWLAVRNPANNFKRYVVGLDIRNFYISKIAGKDYVRDDMQSQGFQFLKAVPLYGGLPRYGIYYVRSWGNSTKAIVIQLGWKLKLEHNTAKYDNPLDYFKGVTFEVNPYKEIG